MSAVRIENLFLDLYNISRNKHQKFLCGDFFGTFGDAEHRVIAMSDGLGSGVRANILATLTSTILGTMLARNVPLEDCVDTVASTLPVSRDHGIAYATFTAVEVAGDTAFLMNYDNPSPILIRGGKVIRYPYSVRFVGDKEVHESRIQLYENDILILMSDGVTHSGIGKHNDNGWSTKEVGQFLMEHDILNLSAIEIGALIQQRCLELCNGENDDDTTTTVLRFCRRSTVNLMMGPPKHMDDDDKVCGLFFGKAGKHVVCGGSTSNMVSRYLGKPIEIIADSGDDEIPDMATIEGVDMVTEGIITIQKIVEMLKETQEDPLKVLQFHAQYDPASRLCHLLVDESTDINIYFGMAANDAHDSIGISFDDKLKSIRELEELLSKLGKNVRISYC